MQANKWVHPKGSGIRIRRVSNQTTLNGERHAYGESFQVTVPARLTGKDRVRRQFDSKQDAEDFAEEQVAGTKRLGEQFFEIEPGERRDAMGALQILRPLKVSLLTVATEYAQAHAKLAGRPLMEAVNYFVRHKPAGMAIKTVDEVYQELLTAKRVDGVSAIYLKDLDVRLGKFAGAFQCPIAELTAATINTWLRKLKCGPRARNNYRGAVKTLCAFAEAHDYLVKDHIDFSKVSRANEGTATVEIFSPEEMQKLLTAAQVDPDDLPPGYNKRYAGPGLLPFLLLGGFAGMRTAEIERQRWEDINIERGFIRVTAVKGNTAQKRLIPVVDNLKQWLSRVRRDSGPVCEIARTSDALSRLAERAKVEWKHNALRHSFASYRLAQVKSAAQVSLEMGNTPKMVFRHYREIVEENEATAWFGISPATPVNVITMAKAS